MMIGQELATSLAGGVGPIILLFNNAVYGTTRSILSASPGRPKGKAEVASTAKLTMGSRQPFDCRASRQREWRGGAP